MDARLDELPDLPDWLDTSGDATRRLIRKLRHASWSTFALLHAPLAKLDAAAAAADKVLEELASLVEGDLREPTEPRAAAPAGR